jgi:S-adenosylmethionine synthetase
MFVETFGTETVENAKIVKAVQRRVRPAPRRHRARPRPASPDLPKTAAYGHFGRTGDDFTWEHTNRVDDLKSALGL